MIYCLEDERNIRELIVYTLCSSGFEALGFESGEDFWAQMKTKKPRLILLDIMLPDEDGTAILKKLKSEENTSNIPVIMVTAKGSEYDKVMSLDLGADDYIVKPFGMMELLARIRAVIRRAERQEEVSEQILQIECLKININKHRVWSEDEKVTLTLKEFEVLRYLMENAGVVLTRDQLLNRVWGYEFDGETRTVDVHIRTLRQKLGKCGEYIETIRGIGYRIGG